MLCIWSFQLLYVKVKNFFVLFLRKWFDSKKSQYIFSFSLTGNEKELVTAPITWWNYFYDAVSVFWLRHYKWRETAELGETWKSVTNGCRKSWYNFVFALYFPYKAKEYLRRGTHQEFPSNILGYECYISFWCLPFVSDWFVFQSSAVSRHCSASDKITELNSYSFPLKQYVHTLQGSMPIDASRSSSLW